MKRILPVILVLCMMLSMVPAMAHAADAATKEYPEISLGTLELDMEASETVWYQFTPEVSGIYRFDAAQSYYDATGYQPQIYVGIYSEEDDTSYDTGNSSAFRQLEAGETYLLSVRNSSYAGSYDNYCSAKAIINFKILDYPELELGVRTSATIFGDEYDSSEARYDYYENGDHAYFLFTPEVTDTYTFRSFSDVETIGEIRDSRNWSTSDGYYLGYGYFNDDRNRGFVAQATLNAGETYILSAGFYFYLPEEERTGSFNVMIEVSHDYAEEVLTEGTCTTEGSSKFTCSHCGDSYTANTSIKHTYADNCCSVCGNKEVYSGTCGDNLTWEVDCTTGVLTISGTGEMYNYRYGYSNNPGWMDACFDYNEYAFVHDISTIEIEEGVTRIGDDAFRSVNACYISHIELPDSVVEIGYNSFGWNNTLSSISLSDNLETIEYGAFEMCEALTSIHIPNKVTTIGDSAFAGCPALSDVSLGNSVKTIGCLAFGGISSTTIVIPESVTYIGGGAFNFSNLSKIRFEGNAPEFGSNDPVGDGSVYYGQFDGVTASAYYPADNPTWTEEVRQDYGGTITWIPYKVYTVLPDSDKAVVVGKEETAAIHVDGALSDFVTVYMDGEEVDAANYTLTEGSTIVTFHADYLNTLPLGEHRVTIEFTDGYAYTNITISDTHEHSYDSVVTAPTCTEQGYTTYTCSCGDSYVDSYTAALGHDFADGTCTRCGEADPDYEEPIPAVSGVIRIAGDDRIATSLGIADQLKETLGVAKFDTVIVASALNFPDALTGSYLAAVKSAPILLTYEAAHAKVQAYIDANLEEGGTVYILGGESAVSAGFQSDLAAKGIRVQRLAGTDRFGTNLEIMKEAGVSADQPVLIATGINFADSLSASAAGLPMVLVYGSLRPEQKAFLETTSGNFVIIGGEAAVSASLENELKAIGTVSRLAGNGRYQTSVMVAEEFVPNPDAVVLAYARNFPDGLCGGPLAYALNAPLILTDNYDPSAADAYVDGITSGIVVGGAGLISDAAARAIFDLAADAPIHTK